MSIPQENQCYWVHPVERGLDHNIGDPADDVLDHRDKEADTNDTFAPSDYAGLTLSFPFFRNFFLLKGNLFLSGSRVAEVGSFSARAKMPTTIFVRRIYLLFSRQMRCFCT